MKTGEKNSLAAAEYARKKKEQLEKANRLRRERERLSSESTAKTNSLLYQENTSAPRRDGLVVQQGGSSSSVFKNDRSSKNLPSSSMVSASRSSTDPHRYSSQGIFDRNQKSIASRATNVTHPDTELSQQMAMEYASLEAPSLQPVAEHIKISKKHYEIARNTSLPQTHQTANRDVVLKKPMQGRVLSPRDSDHSVIAASSSVSGPTSLSQARNLNAPYANSTSFFLPPDEPSGRCLDLSDRLHICMSTNNRNEVVVGNSDHALYSVDISDPRKRPITMYSKKYGHTDWVTGVAHLPNGNVISASMDGKLCLWDTSRRRCVDIFGHEGSITKVISDKNYNFAISLGYDGNLLAWNFGNSTSFNPNAVYSPVCTFMGHKAPILECSYHNGGSSTGGGIICSGAKNGGMYLWDVETGAVISRYKAHKTPITSLEWLQGTNLFMTGGADGFVKVWDPREKNVVQRIAAHTSDGGGGSSGGFDTSIGPPKSSYAAAVACLACTAGDGEGGVGGGGLGHVISGGSDSAVKVLDLRGGAGSFSVVESFEHHNNGIYSLCTIGNRCVVSGDGVGMLLVYDIFESGNNALKYGLGASGAGAVRAVTCVEGKLVSACEDGNVVIHNYHSAT